MSRRIQIAERIRGRKTFHVVVTVAAKDDGFACSPTFPRLTHTRSFDRKRAHEVEALDRCNRPACLRAYREADAEQRKKEAR